MYIKLYPFNPNPLCTTHKQPQKQQQQKNCEETFFLCIFYFHFGKQITELKLKELLLCCCCYALCWRNGEPGKILISKVNFFYISPTSQAAKQKHKELEKKAKENNKTKLYHNQLVRGEGVSVGGG